jgi:NHLM bacteriocin system ABC transporter ATP-binding protein
VNIASLIDTLSVDHKTLIDAAYPQLNDNDFLWVEAGAVDCFIRNPSQQSELGGRLVHLFRIGKGELCPTLANLPIDQPDQLVWSILPNSSCWQLQGDAFVKHLQTEQSFTIFEQTLAQWLDTSSRQHIQSLAPSLYHDINSFETQPHALSTQSELSTADTLAWLQLRSGQLKWLGNKQASFSATDGSHNYLPVHRRHWLTVTEDSELQNTTLAELIRKDQLFPALLNYYQLLLLHRLDKQNRDTRNNVEKLKLKEQDSSRQVNEALYNLVGVMQERPAPVIDNSQSLLGALRQIEKTQALDFKLEEQQGQLEDDNKNAVEHLCTFSSVRKRQVALKGHWWKKDSGPLLVREEESPKWYCALPLRSGGYVLHDGSDGSTLAMNEDMASNLDGFGVSFYRSFDNVPLKPLGILKFGLHGLKNDVITVLGMGILVGLLGIIMPIATGKIVESVIPSGHEPTLWIFGAALITAMISSTLFGLTRSIVQLRIEGKMDGAVQAAVWDRVLKLPVTFFRQYSAGDLSTRISAINTIRAALSGSTISTIMTSLFSSFNLILLFYYDSKIAMIACGLVLGALIILFSVGYLKLRYERQIAEAHGQLSSLVFEYLSGINKLRTASAENRAFFNWSTRFAHLRHLSFRAQQLGNIDDTLFSGYQLATTAVIFAAVGMSLSQGSDEAMSIGQFIAFNAAFGSFFAGIISLSDTALGLINLIPIYERAKPILEQVPENDGDKSPPEAIQGAIDIARLNFSYPDGPTIIDDLSFKIRAGEFIALVGPSGSGKSTILRLLLGFESPSDGSIHYDNQDMSQLDLNALRRHIGVVLQGGQLLTGDIYQNIIGSHPLTLEDAWEAAEMVGLDKDIRQMPMGMHTVISEGASTLSGGQRQRILIARAIVTRPRILFFDEATSALDNKTQAVVSRSLENLKSTRVVIAHRLSTIINADRIIVLDRGKIVQQGTYTELMSNDGAFKDLALRQLA